ncbi:TetR/AcrR family transcriptional regulator [Flavobacterium muglaense]|uniref:TetR/AcrR family transcriptional regulator n=1 Tax=Flavobacterium muglaense TaxID=2764716 RepID=A0A923MYF0_9FLAO|nr:TetR/AcrR family transcriptional regulator [Flavobacterium muglaense]MBC5838103.1 TetR/AcrR family transcriptional regulator [Flavobacterium muglaense]MBC5844593.1 TetR/AcrR family transcriptional regulator [Flavobacterium muglaense]
MNKKDSILLAALHLLSTRGVHDTPMSAVAKVAGTGMGTIYNYFPTKDILINEIYTYIKQQEAAVFIPFVADQPIKPQFEFYFQSIITFFNDNIVYFQFMEQLQASPIITEESKQTGITAIQPVYELIAKGQKDGFIKDIETGELLQFIGGAILSFLRNYTSANQLEKPIVSNYINMSWDAIKV